MEGRIGQKIASLEERIIQRVADVAVCDGTYNICFA